MAKAIPIDLAKALGALTPLRNRTPQTSDAEREGAFARIAPYRDGGLFIAAFAGRSAWERHSVGDELVHALEGETDLVLLQDGQEVRHRLRQGELIVVPQGTWHRFETEGVRLMTATPQPTDHYTGDGLPEDE
ncbi:MAG: cupin domain-containing protein [Sneathiellaceae bacterium]